MPDPVSIEILGGIEHGGRTDGHILLGPNDQAERENHFISVRWSVDRSDQLATRAHQRSGRVEGHHLLNRTRRRRQRLANLNSIPNIIRTSASVGHNDLLN